MADITPDVQGQPPVSIGISMPLSSTPAPEPTISNGSLITSFVAAADGYAGIGISQPLTARQILGEPKLQDIYLAYLTRECPPMPQFGGVGQIFPWVGVVGGENGQSPVLRNTGTHIQWSIDSVNWVNLVALSEITGPPGAAAYVHTQATPSGSWVINHNLGYKPGVELVSLGGQEIDGDVLHTSTNQTVCSFNPPATGQARLT